MRRNQDHIVALQKQLESLQTEYQQKLDSQSSKFLNSTLESNAAASSKLIESFKTLDTAHREIDRLQKEVETVKAMKSGRTENEILTFRLKQEEQRREEAERKWKALQSVDALKSERKETVVIEAMESVPVRIAREFEEMLTVDHCKLFGVLLDFMVSHRRTWNEQYIVALIHELLFNVLMECFVEIQRFEGTLSMTLCKELGINESILKESMLSEWIDSSKCDIFVHSADAVKEAKSAVTDGVFLEQFMTRHLGLSSHQIPQQIHFQFASFLRNCIDISWKMSVQSPALQFTPTVFRPDAAKKMNFYDELHCVRGGDEAAKHILYFIWPIITENGYHSVKDGVKIAVCLGDTLPPKMSSNGRDGDHYGAEHEDADGDESVDREESMEIVIFNHDPDQYHAASSQSALHQQHLHDISDDDESPFVAMY